MLSELAVANLEHYAATSAFCIVSLCRCCCYCKPTTNWNILCDFADL